MATIDLPKMDRSAELQPATFNDSENTVEVIWTTGAAVRRSSWEGPFDEELVVSGNAVRLGRLSSGAPFLNSHSAGSLSDVLGSVVPGSVRLKDGKGYARVKLSSAEQDKDIVTKIKEGVIKNISVGYRVHQVEKLTRGDKQVPLWRVVDWEPYELSAVPIPADAGAQFRSEGAECFPCQVIERDGIPDAIQEAAIRTAIGYERHLSGFAFEAAPHLATALGVDEARVRGLLAASMRDYLAAMPENPVGHAASEAEEAEADAERGLVSEDGQGESSAARDNPRSWIGRPYR